MDVCPVCNRAGLHAFALTCPQCNADLECFRLLDALRGGEAGREEVAEAVEEEGTATGQAVVVPYPAIATRNSVLLWVLVGLVLAGWVLDRWQLLLKLDALESRVMTTGKEDRSADHWVVLEQGIIPLMDDKSPTRD